MHANIDTASHESPAVEPISPSEDVTNIGDEERAVGHHPSRSPTTLSENEIEATRSSSPASSGGYLKRKTSQLIEAVTSSSQKSGNAPLAPNLLALVEAYNSSSIAAGIRAEGEEIRREQIAQNNTQNVVGTELPDVVIETSLLRGRKRASWTTQFRILSGRAFKNLYRDPALLAAHYLSSIALARESQYNLFCDMLTWSPQ